MFETIKKYKILLIIVILIWTTLMGSYIFYIKESYKNIQLKELQKQLILSNSTIYNIIGQEYFDRAISIEAIDSKEYHALQAKIANQLDLLDVTSFAAGLPQFNDYNLMITSSSIDDNLYETVNYFAPYIKKFKPSKSFEADLLAFLNSNEQAKFFNAENKVNALYAYIEKKHLSNNRVILISSSYSRSKFDAALKVHENKEIKHTIFLFIIMLPIAIYVIFIFLAERKQIKYRLLHHRLTGLKNIHALMKKKFKKAALIYIDIEFFAEYNRLYGYAAGSKLIQEFASMINYYIDHPNYEYYTFNGNDFGIFIEGINETDLENEIQNVITYLNGLQFRINDTLTVTLRTRIGATIDGDPESLFDNAHSACSVAKHKGVHYYIYDHEIDRKNYLHTLEKVIQAIKDDNIKVCYQPIIDINEKPVKYEALIRLYDNGAYLSPSEFLPIAKMSGYYYDLTMIVLKQVLSDVEAHKIHASINLSYDDISNEKHADAILSLLSKSTYPQNITVELLESSVIEDFSLVISFTEKLKKLGVKVAIDDYGSEYSSIENILKIKPDCLKIDGSIVKNIVNDNAALTVLSITTMAAKSLDMKVIAEYVATKEIFDAAKSVGVELFQGYYYSEPKLLSELL